MDHQQWTNVSDSRPSAYHGGAEFEAPDQGPARVDARSVLGEARQVIIVHQGQEYRLQRTRSDKLILTK